MTLRSAGSALAGALLLAAISGEAEANAPARHDAPSCSSVRSDHEKWSEQLKKRVQAMRAAGRTARAAGKPDPNDQGGYVRLMNDIEQAEGRFRAGSKNCVEG